MHLALWYVVLVWHQYDVCKNYVGSVYVGGYGGLSEIGLCVLRELYPVSFLVVGESPRCPVVKCVRHRGDIWCCSVVLGTLVDVFVLCGPSC